ncbi:oligosaccharide flippase family protein [Enterobacter hormaechei]|uniref:oligosaccharide flippase family protein n=1 Tax=Enterobacter hormaechei TaxID=158836 RepID=UPI00069B0DC6|nr:oligosaccharide flippase family protein [Enterobacter hormaechei]
MKTKQKILSNIYGLSSLNIINILVPLIMMPYLSRTIGADGYGVFFIFTSAISFALIIMDYSVNITGVRDISQSNKMEWQEIYTKNQSIRFCLCFLSIIACTYYTIVFADGYDDKFLFTFIIYAITLFGYYFTTPWFFHGASDMKIVALSSLITRLLHLLFVIAFINSRKDLDILILSNAISYLLIGVVTSFYRRSRYKLKDKLNAKLAKSGFISGFDSFIGDFAPNLYSNMPQIIIGAIVSPSVFAAYSIAMRLINIAGSFQVIICKSFYPLMRSGLFSLKYLLCLNIALSAIAIAFVYFFGMPLIVLLFGSNLSQAYYYLLPLSLSMAFAGVLWSFSYGYFLPNGLDREFRNISVIASVLSAAIGYCMIYAYGAYGAIAMFVFARFLFACLYTIKYLLKIRSHYNVA